MATYITFTGEKFIYKGGDYWCDAGGVQRLDMPHSNLPVPPLIASDGTKRCDGHFELVITNSKEGLIIELDLVPVPDLIMQWGDDYPGFVISPEQCERITAALNLSEDDVEYLADLIPYAINDGFDLCGRTIDLSDLDGLGSRPIEWKLN